MVHSQKLEKQVIGGLIKHQEIYPEIAPFISVNDFFFETNQVIFTVIKNALDNRQTIDPVIIENRVSASGILFTDVADISDHINGLSLIQSTPESIKQAVKDLKVITAKRDYIEVCNKIRQNLMDKKNTMSYDEVSSFVDRELYSKVQAYSGTSDAIDLFSDMQTIVEDWGNNPKEDIGLKTPYPAYNKMYGGLENGNVYVFAARPKMGKSTLLSDLTFNLSNVTNNVPCLVLDTEMTKLEVQSRLCASISGVPVYYIKSGLWRRVPEFVTKIRAAWKIIKENGYKFHHEYVAGKTIDEIVNIIKKFQFTKVGRGNQCVIVYDYLKLTGETLSESYKEYQAIGDKVSRLKDLVTTEVTAPLLTAIQINRAGVNGAADDTSVISLSDRVLWFASQVSIFRRKTPEERMEENDRFGSHKLIILESRHQGIDAAGHNDLVRDLNNNLVHNFLNFNIDNFKVNEVGSAESMFTELSGKTPVQNSQPDNPFAPITDAVTPTSS